MSGISRPVGPPGARQATGRHSRALGLVASVAAAASLTAAVLWATSLLVTRWG